MDLRWVCGVEHQKRGMTGLRSESFRQYLRPKARATHPQKHDVGELWLSYILGQGLHTPGGLEFFSENFHPAEPLAFIACCPKLGIAVPEPAHAAGAPPS